MPAVSRYAAIDRSRVLIVCSCSCFIALTGPGALSMHAPRRSVLIATLMQMHKRDQLSSAGSVSGSVLRGARRNVYWSAMPSST